MGEIKKLATNMERVSSSVNSRTIYRCMSDSHLRDVGDETEREKHLAPDAIMLLCVG